MAIEFNCPYCTATVRVGAEAAGKVGRCPKCDTRVRIPEIQPATGSSSPASQPPAASPLSPPIPDTTETTPPEVFPDLTKPTEPAQPAPVSPDGLPLIQATETPVLSKYVKRRKKSANWAPLIPPLLFGGLFVGIGLIFYMMTRPSYEGELTGIKLDPNQVISVSIQGGMYNIPKQAFHELVDELRQRPSAVRSNLVNLRFDAGAGDALKVSLRPGIEADLIRVPILELEAVQKYYDDHYSELDDRRLHELQAALIALCDDWTNAPEDQKLKTLPDYRDKIAYNAFVKGLGRICEAVLVVDGTPARFPCVHEDSAGSLAFLVPVGTSSFVIRQRVDINASFFPSTFEVKVSVPLPTTNPEIIPDAPVDPSTIEPIPVDESVMRTETATDATSTDQSPEMKQPE